MSSCLCGNPANGNGMFCSRCAALQVLELNPSATEKQIKNAYRILAKVWHPDRFQSDKPLREAAESKLNDINSAYVFLTSKSKGNAGGRRSESEDKGHGWDAQSPRDEPTAARTAKRKPAAATIPIQAPTAWIFPSLKFSLKLFLAAFVLLLVRYIWIAFNVQDPTSDAAARVLSYGKDTVLGELEEPKRRFLEAVEADLKRLGLREAARPTQVLPQTGAAAEADQPQTRRPATTKAARAAPFRVYPYITIGSTRDEVIDQVGTPTAFAENKLVYGSSELYLKDNSVIGWRIDPVSSPIRVKVWPESSVDPDLDSFTVGSSMDVVLAVQGTPMAFSEDKFGYGGSEVYFQNRRVVRWKNDPDSISLHARLP